MDIIRSKVDDFIYSIEKYIHKDELDSELNQKIESFVHFLKTDNYIEITNSTDYIIGLESIRINQDTKKGTTTKVSNVLQLDLYKVMDFIWKMIGTVACIEELKVLSVIGLGLIIADFKNLNKIKFDEALGKIIWIFWVELKKDEKELSKNKLYKLYKKYYKEEIKKENIKNRLETLRKYRIIKKVHNKKYSLIEKIQATQ